MYKEQIQNNKDTLVSIMEHTTNQILDMRRGEEEEKMNNLKEFQRIQIKLQHITFDLDSLPNRVAESEAKVEQCEEITFKMKQNVSDIQKEMLRLENEKCDREFWNKWKDNMESRMNFIESTFDALNDKNKSIENWIDVYMPLRIQHQITETIKESLTPKGKYILGVVDNLMCTEYRDRVFTDVGNPKLKERCLDIIKQLKIDSKTLTASQDEVITDAQTNYDKWNQEVKDDK